MCVCVWEGDGGGSKSGTVGFATPVKTVVPEGCTDGKILGRYDVQNNNVMAHLCFLLECVAIGLFF